ncbi:hypothetical protein Tco_0371271 [Tanacetum coccineum]
MLNTILGHPLLVKFCADQVDQAMCDTARKLSRFSQVPTMYPPGDIMVHTSQPKRALTPLLFATIYKEPTSLSRTVTLANVKENFTHVIDAQNSTNYGAPRAIKVIPRKPIFVMTSSQGLQKYEVDISQKAQKTAKRNKTSKEWKRNAKSKPKVTKMPKTESHQKGISESKPEPELEEIYEAIF